MTQKMTQTTVPEIDATTVNQIKCHTQNNPLSSRKQTIAKHFSRAAHYDEHAHIQQRVCEKLIAEVRSNTQDSVIEIGAGSGQLTRLLADNVNSKHWLINELCATHQSNLQAILPNAQILIGDAETLNLNKYKTQQCLVISANAIQWFDNPLGFIEQVHSLLKPEGQLLFSTFTPNNFMQIKALTGQGLVYPTIEQWQKQLQDFGFTDISLVTHRYDLTFDSPYAVLKHMKNTGVSTNQTDTSQQNQRFVWTKTRLKAFEEEYWQQFSSYDNQGNECVTLTYDALVISAIKA